jgi:subtilisin family serine protease
MAAGAGLLASALLASSLPADATPSSPTSSTSGTIERGFVVGVDAADTDAAYQSITAAGGAVVEVNRAAGLALVSGDDQFADRVRDTRGITGAARNHAVGTSRQGMPHAVASDRLTASETAAAPAAAPAVPLTELQWDMAMINAPEAHAVTTGAGVTVGIIDTGVDAAHPDLAANFDHELSRNFTHDMPDIDGPCEVTTCIDPADVDEGGHGTHVAGTVAAADNGFGITGVAPDATIVNLRAGQDSGYFFLWETVSALTYAADAGIDVVNMSFYTDPWLYNCASRDDYVSGRRLRSEVEEQAFARERILAATAYADAADVTMVAAAGNGFTDLAAPTREDRSSPDYPAGSERRRVVTSNCLDLPSEAPEVISVSSVGPSTTKADYSNYGLGAVELAAPGGWFRDLIGTPAFRTDANQILSTYPFELAVAEGLVSEAGEALTTAAVTDCTVSPCAVYAYLQGTSMASPHVAGVAALVVAAHGDPGPDVVRSILETTAVDRPCPAGGVEIYTDEGRPAEYDAVCEGTAADNGHYGEGIVDALAAVS